ncbi:putative GMC-type oxidoreductase [Baekduia alba]|uniref:GMC family oxidoreductase n=1 Tax=Baekduia alba TaxID=2997333 RepID=UPI00233FA0F9|nr:GMC family oxidoreductase [Baekduia alba]WCB92600.1 putative GMC-type oxidoreductase [Baekduia alba]
MSLLAEPTTGGVVDGTHITGERRLRADVVIVGSGAGGAPVARAFAQAGKRVVVLEDGAHFTRDQLTARPRDMTALLYRDAGQAATVGTPSIMLPTGRAVGGTTLVNSGTCFRAPRRVQERWAADELGLTELGPGALDDAYDRVERDIGVARVPERLAGANALIAKRGAERLGWSGRFLDRNAVGCQGSGVCAFGCPTGAKQHAGEVYMNAAHAAGATTYTATRARRIALDADGTARGVVARTRAGGTITVTAPTTVIAAGTLHTPLLLAASGVHNAHLGRHLSIHPATAAWAIMDEVVDMARGVPQSYGIDEFASEGIMLEGIAGPPDYLAMAVPFSGPAHRELMLDYRRVAQFGLMIEDTSRGHIPVGRLARRAGRPIVRYDLNARDVKTIKNGVKRLAELLFAAGARRVILPLASVPELRDGDLTPLTRHTATAAELKVMAFHPLGTARMAKDPNDGVTDADNKVHGTTNLHVCDGSAVPGPLGVNPQLTIMALATRLADRLLA